MEIKKLKSGKIQLTIKSKKDLAAMLIRFYTDPETILKAVKKHDGHEFPHDEIPELIKLYQESVGKESDRVINYITLKEIIDGF